MTYAALDLQVQRMGRALHAIGAGPHTRVALCLPNGPAMASAFLGVASFTACAPLNPGYQPAEFRFYLEDSRAAVVVLDSADRGPLRDVAGQMGLRILELDTASGPVAGAFAPLADLQEGVLPERPASASDVALLLHTSGTTARPKIVPLTHANLAASGANIARHLALVPADRCLNVMPLFHIHGLVGVLLATVHSAGSVVCTPGFDPERFFDWVGEFEPTWYSAVPTVHQAVVAAGARYSLAAPAHRFRFVRSSSAALSPATFKAVEALLEAPVIESYGMTEASHQMTSNPLPPAPRKAGTVGVAAGADVAIMGADGRLLAAGETGEVVIRGPGVTLGYENNAAANDAAFVDGWFRTGDQGCFDADGYLSITGRLKEIVNRGGEKIAPREIDDALLEIPGVLQAIAFAVPHGSLGEDLVAAVVVQPGAGLTEAALRDALLGRLADYKVPSQIVFVQAIPKGPTGKVQRSALHEKLRPLLAQPFVAPADDVQRVLAGLFAQILGCAPVGLHDNFFGLGGDSLKGAQVMARVNAELGVELPATTLFRSPTIAQLALSVEQAIAAEIDAMSDEQIATMLRDADHGR